MKTPNSKNPRLSLWCLTALAALQMSGSAATLTNRYSFNEALGGTNLTDSVSGQNGALINTTLPGTGQAVIANTSNSGDPSGQYISLPPNLLTNYTAVTMETWITPTLDDVTAGAFWARVWDFGNSDGTGGIPGFFWFRVGNDSQGIRGDIVTPSTGDVLSSTKTLLNGQENHIVWTSDGTTQKAKVYVNGVLVGFNDSFPNTPASMGTTTNDWLGRSQFSADPYENASYNEFRIYQGTLNPLEVAADFQAGADTLPGAVGSVTNIQIQVATPLALNSSTRAAVLASATGLTNQAIDIVDSSLAVTLSSGNTNVATVDTNGFVHAVGVGDASIIASFNSLSSTQSVHVYAAPTALKNRYSFTTDASDSVGGANGTLMGTATVSNNQVYLDGTAGTYVSLPAGLVGVTNFVNGAFTFQAWVSVYPADGVWAPICSFGNVSGTLGVNYTFLTPNAGGGNNRFSVGTVGSEDQANGPTLLGVTNVQVTAVYNPTRGFMGLYVNGALVGSGTQVVSSLSEINNAYSFLGRSLFSGDPYFIGSIDEFRIYDGELDKFQVDATYVEGPNVTNLDIGTLQSFTFTTGAPLPKDATRLVQANLHFTVATNVNVAGDPALTLTSTDTNIVTVNAAGVMTGHNPGTATINAVYHYVVGATTNVYTGSSPVTVFRDLGATLQHRYSFTTDASDSIGGANGTNQGNATISNGALVLDGSTGTYLNLPGGLLTSNQSMTIECWAAFGASASWARLFDFGSTTGFGTNTTGPQAFFWGSPDGGGTLRSDIATGAGFANVLGGPTLNNRTVHFVETYDPTNGVMTIYTNGVIALMNATAANVPLSSISPDDAFIGRSQFSADPYLIATIDEFRIYGGVLYSDEIRATDLLGPNQLLTTAGVGIQAQASAGSLVLKWPLAAAGFTLQSRSSLGSGSWSPVSTLPQIVGSGGVTNWQVTMPLSGGPAFFRLTK